jgi:hypothetical protein
LEVYQIEGCGWRQKLHSFAVWAFVVGLQPIIPTLYTPLGGQFNQSPEAAPASLLMLLAAFLSKKYEILKVVVGTVQNRRL